MQNNVIIVGGKKAIIYDLHDSYEVHLLASDIDEEVDVLIDNSFTIQAKCRKKLADFLIPSEHVDSVVFKQDRGETLILLRFNDFLTNYYMKPEVNNEK